MYSQQAFLDKAAKLGDGFEQYLAYELHTPGKGFTLAKSQTEAERFLGAK